MPVFRTSRRVRHSPEAMFALVADVGRYPEFVPLCERLTIRSRQTRQDGTELVIASMTIGYQMFHETFTSRVVLDHAKQVIEVSYVDGPFKHLDNRWTFQAADGGASMVGFFLSYEFRSRILGAVMGAVFDRVYAHFVEAFEKRADIIYGRPVLA